MATLESARINRVVVGNVAFPYIAVHIAGTNDAASVTLSITRGDFTAWLVPKVAGNQVAGFFATSHDSPAYYAGATAFNLTSGDYNLRYTVGDYQDRIQYSGPHLYFRNVQIDSTHDNWGYTADTPFCEFYPSIIFVNENNKIYKCSPFWFGWHGSIPASYQGNMYYAPVGGYSTIFPSSSIGTLTLVSDEFDYTDIDTASAENPYTPGGISDPGGGLDGAYHLVGDTIDFPEKPTLSALSTGFVSIWTPTEQQIVDLARYMWNADLLTVDFWRKLVANPIDLIYSLAIFPCTITPDGNDIVCVGLTSTGVRMNYYDSQYFDVDCGSILLEKYWDAYLDYSPYTKVNIYLPFIGVKPLQVDEIMGDRIQVKYRIDLASGVCVAFIRCGDSVLYQFSGNCATQIPVTSLQFADLVRSAVTLGTAVGASLATAGAAGPAAISAAASLATSKPDVAHSGAIGNAAGLMAVQRPYLIVTRPRQAMPENQQTYTGFPSFITQDFSELEGYTEIESVHLHDIPATQREIDEIEKLLIEGVIF